MAVTTLLNCVTNDPYKYSYTKLAIILCFNIWLYFSVYPRQVLTLFPSARGLEVTWSSVLKIGQSLFCEGPGKDPFRPDQKTPVQNFFVAGSYTKQVINGAFSNQIHFHKIRTVQTSYGSRHLLNLIRLLYLAGFFGRITSIVWKTQLCQAGKLRLTYVMLEKSWLH